MPLKSSSNLQSNEVYLSQSIFLLILPIDLFVIDVFCYEISVIVDNVLLAIFQFADIIFRLFECYYSLLFSTPVYAKLLHLLIYAFY